MPAPSTEEIALAAADESWIPAGLEPTATQVCADEQAIELSAWDPPSTVPICQAEPESFVVRIPAPTAMHAVELVQATEPIPRVPSGMEASDQEIPPSADVNNSPAYGPPGSGDTPTATHRLGDVQLTPRRVVFWTGRESVDQVSPPSSELMRVFDPTATQFSVPKHATPSNSGVPDGT